MKELNPEWIKEIQTLYRQILENGGFIPITSLPPWGKDVDGHFITPEEIITHLEANGINADITAAFDEVGNIRHDLITIFIDPGE